MGTDRVLSIRHIAESDLRPAPLKAPEGYIRRRLDGSLSPEYQGRLGLPFGRGNRTFQGEDGVIYIRSSIGDGGCVQRD
jgi:hypothetical protein